MTIGSLFSGIGGLELGLERAGLGPTMWQVENDPFCRSVLARHWPNATRHKDVTTVDPGQLAPVDLICGGFPCQDISLAGKGAGLAGERSGLWWEFARIIRGAQPRWVVIENVAALVNRGLDAVLWTLAAGGYDAWWDCIPAAAVGAPHRRDRLFIVAWRVSDTNGDAIRQQSGRGTGANRPGRTGPGDVGEGVADRECPGPQGGRSGATQGAVERSGSPAVADCHSRGQQGERLGGLLDGERSAQRDDADGCSGEELEHAYGIRRDGRAEIPGPEARAIAGPTVREPWPPAPNDLYAWGRVPMDTQPAICRVAYGLPDRVGQLRALGNAVVPQVAEVIGRAIFKIEQESMT